MIWESFYSQKNEPRERDFSRGLPLLMLSVATSIHALAVGVSLAVLSANMAVAVLTIGMVCFLITGAGFLAGTNAPDDCWAIGPRLEAVSF